MAHSTPPVISFDNVKRTDTGLVGGKNASLGEMIRALRPKGIHVPPALPLPPMPTAVTCPPISSKHGFIRN